MTDLYDDLVRRLKLVSREDLRAIDLVLRDLEGKSERAHEDARREISREHEPAEHGLAEWADDQHLTRVSDAPARMAVEADSQPYDAIAIDDPDAPHTCVFVATDDGDRCETCGARPVADEWDRAAYDFEGGAG